MTNLSINGRVHAFAGDPSTPLLYVLRGELELNGAKFGCGLGQCAACLVLVDGAPTPSCITPVSELQGREVMTVEGLTKTGKLSRIQSAFVKQQAAQCGYCTAGMLIRSYALLSEMPKPSDAQVREYLEPNLCRCGTHLRVMRAIHDAAQSGEG